MEMQFYPPGWVPWPAGTSCDATHWCAALNIDSYSDDPNRGVKNNTDCKYKTSLEPVNFAFITTNGAADSPADPLNPGRDIPNLSHDLLMNPGDTLVVDMRDTRDGFQVVIIDLTTKQKGSMTASITNGFAQVNFEPSASTCTSTPYAFHPMYATSGPHTRVPWAAHSYNVAFADEIGHFEYCNKVGRNGRCIVAGAGDRSRDKDDTVCFKRSDSTRIRITGCINADADFDGLPYQLRWPGTIAANDASLHPDPITFRSPLFKAEDGTPANYSQVAFEADLPRIESGCNRASGKGCVNPPRGAKFYPFFSTRSDANLGCVWQLGGGLIPATANAFGGSSKAEFGKLLALTYPTVDGPQSFFNDLRNILSNNPCNASADDH